MSDKATPVDREAAFEAWRNVLPGQYPIDSIERIAFLAGYDASAARVAELEKVLKAISDGDVPRPIAHPWRQDGKPSKHDRCRHGVTMYEDRGECIAEFADRASTPGEGGDHVR